MPCINGATHFLRMCSCHQGVLGKLTTLSTLCEIRYPVLHIPSSELVDIFRLVKEAMSIPAPPAGVNLQESQQYVIVVSLFSTWTLAIIVVCLRFASRVISKVGFWLDDWLIIPAMVSKTKHSC